MRVIICNETVLFRPYCGGVVTRTQNVSEYMLVLALCLVHLSVYWSVHADLVDYESACLRVGSKNFLIYAAQTAV